MVSRKAFEKKMDELNDIIGSLAIEVSRMRSELDVLKRETEDARKTDAEKENEERFDKLFRDGLTEILAYDGRPSKEGSDGK